MNKALPAALGTALTAAFVLFAILVEPAYADVLLTDQVLGTSAQERGLAIEEMPDILATHAIIMHPDGSVYYERGADSPIKIASTTKVMTALVALDHCDPSETLTVDRAAATVGESCVGLKEGDTLTLEQALTGLMVMSGNDVATAIATHVGGKIDPASADPYGTFIKAMNDRAAQLGCTDTLFENPHGLDFGAWVGNLHSTAHDVTRIWAEAWRNEAFRSFACSGATEMHVTSADGSARSLPLTVRNKILGRDGNLGGKTGSTYEAGECFVCTFSREPEGEVYIALFGSKGDDGRFNDTLTLANWYYGHFANLPFATSPKQVGGVPLAAEAACVDWSDKLMDLTFADADAAARVFTLGGPIEQKVEVTSSAANTRRELSRGRSPTPKTARPSGPSSSQRPTNSNPPIFSSGLPSNSIASCASSRASRPQLRSAYTPPCPTRSPSTDGTRNGATAPIPFNKRAGQGTNIPGRPVHEEDSASELTRRALPS